MIIDIICDALETGAKKASPETQRYLYDEAVFFGFDDLAAALDCGTVEDVRRALCEYIDAGLYNPELKKVVEAVVWVD